MSFRCSHGGEVKKGWYFYHGSTLGPLPIGSLPVGRSSSLAAAWELVGAGGEEVLRDHLAQPLTPTEDSFCARLLAATLHIV